VGVPPAPTIVFYILEMNSKLPRPECKFGTFLLQRTLSVSSKHTQPPLRLSYRIMHPQLLNISNKQEDSISSHQPAPLLVVHGGPSLPSEYLTPLANHLKNRAIVFYDQLGCGWSSQPRENEWYGVLQMSQDLGELVRHLKEVWNVHKFHLLGHSLGGAIGFEFLKAQILAGRDGSSEHNPLCLSLILSNASTNFQLSSSEQIRLFQEFQLQHSETKMHETSLSNQFFQFHICRTPIKPAELELALSRRGMEWSANEYSAMPLAPASTVAANGTTELLPPILIVRGLHDFVTETCTRGWNDIFASSLKDGHRQVKEVILDNCAHYPHFEQPERYACEIEQFCSNSESL
jgi:proline iminopeptidase